MRGNWDDIQKIIKRRSNNLSVATLISDSRHSEAIAKLLTIPAEYHNGTIILAAILFRRLNIQYIGSVPKTRIMNNLGYISLGSIYIKPLGDISVIYSNQRLSRVEAKEIIEQHIIQFRATCALKDPLMADEYL